jgi:hypothetical protein
MTRLNLEKKKYNNLKYKKCDEIISILFQFPSSILTEGKTVYCNVRANFSKLINCHIKYA